MKTVITCSFVFIFTSLLMDLQAQADMPWDIWRNPVTSDFETIRQQAENWFRDKPKGQGTGYKQFKRWEEFNITRLDANRQIVNVGAKNYEAHRQLRPAQSNQRNMQGDWKPWSAIAYENVGSWSPGIGRINDISFHPTDPDIIFVATPAGGVFKTTNHGETWTCLTDTLGSIGASGIAVNPNDPNNIFVLTGDGDGGDTRSIGVYKTVNGGDSWTATGLTWELTDDVKPRKLIMEPGFPSWMLVASTNGLWQSTDSGNSWNVVQAGSFYDIEYHPTSSHIVYATAGNAIWKSTDYGQTWAAKYFPSGATRIEIAVSPDAEDNVYLFAGPSHLFVNTNVTPPDTTYGFKGVYRSVDAGETFATVFNLPNILSSSFDGSDLKHQTGYDLAIVSDPEEDSILHFGGVNIWKAHIGQSLSINAFWAIPSNVEYVHADVHDLVYNPLNNNLYAACDGGIFYTEDHGVTWIDITGGLNISQLYHFAGTEQDVNFMLGGMQDNGTGIFTENDTLQSLLGADGGDVLIDPTNIDILYAMTQEGYVSKSVNGGTSFSSIKPASTGDGPFVTRWDMDMSRPDTIYMGWTNDTICRTFNGGTSWTKIKLPGNDEQDIRSISVASNGSTIYATTYFSVFRSTNYGTTWTQIDSAFAPGGTYTSITAHPTNPNIAIYTRGGFEVFNQRVMMYNNGTISEVKGIIPNVGVLPQVPVNTVGLHVNNGFLEVYAGTDIGIYYFTYASISSGWTYFKRGLPNVIINDIEIYPDEGIMRVATFGRGIWQSDLWDDCSYELLLTQGDDPDNGMPVSQFHEAADKITSSRLITGANGNVTYKSGDLIILSDGFRATQGNTVRVGLKPCGISLD